MGALKRFLGRGGFIERKIRKSAVAADIAHRVTAKYRALVTSPLVINHYVRDHSLRKLQIGAGDNNLPGWLNTDYDPRRGQAYVDATKPFPFPDRFFNYVFSEHVIEHLTYEQGLAMLKECYRVLAPGGKVRIATPNLLKFVELFQDTKTDEMWRFMQRKIEYCDWPRTAPPECLMLNLELRSWGHQFVYDPRTLRDSLPRAGFRMIAEFLPGESDDPELRGVEIRHNLGEREMNDYETMVFQAVRP